MPTAERGARLDSCSPSAAILIVDDHDGFRAFARRMLEAAGFTVAEAATGAEATEAARTVRPGLVLLDIQLPDFDGFEVARRLAALAGGPVVVLTSTREARDYGGRITSSPAAGFLPKDQLSGTALRRFLARARVRGRSGMTRRLLAGADRGRGPPRWVASSGRPGPRHRSSYADLDQHRGRRAFVHGGRARRLAAVAGQPAGPAVHDRRLSLPRAVRPGQPGQSGCVHDREPEPGFLRGRPGAPGPGLAQRAAPLKVRARRGHRRIRVGGRLQRGLDDVLESRLQRLQRQLPGQLAARPTVPGRSGMPSTR